MPPRDPDRRSLLRNSAYIMLTAGANSALGYAFWLVIARSYEAREVGVASALIAAMTVVAALANLGTSTALVQRLPGRASAADWSRTLTASIATATVAGLAFALLAATLVVPAVDPSLADVDSDAGHLLLFTIGVPLWSLSVVSDFLFVAERRSQNMFARNLVFALSLVAGYAVLLPGLRHRYRPALAGIAAEVRAMATSFAGNYFVSLGFLLTTFLLPVLVVARLSASENAYFYVTWLLGGAFFTVTTAVGSALFAEGSHDAAGLGEQTRQAARITAVLLTPLMLAFLIGAEPILGVFGDDYADNGRTLLLLLTAAAPPDAVTGIYIARVRATGRLRFPAALSMGMAALTLVGAWVLLPEHGLEGAGLAFLGAQLLGTLACAVHWARER
jgi:O-antigen/teichoic acid export membrane protein